MESNVGCICAAIVLIVIVLSAIPSIITSIAKCINK